MTPTTFLDLRAVWANTTVDIGPNVVAVIIALIAFATTVFNGVMAVKTRQTVKDVLAEQKPNGGASQRDAIDRIEKHVESTNKAVTKLPPPPPPQ